MGFKDVVFEREGSFFLFNNFTKILFKLSVF